WATDLAKANSAARQRTNIHATPRMKLCPLDTVTGFLSRNTAAALRRQGDTLSLVVGNVPATAESNMCKGTRRDNARPSPATATADRLGATSSRRVASQSPASLASVINKCSPAKTQPIGARIIALERRRH